MITIDGSFGEGGGQILRTSLALSILTGQNFRIKNIRAARKKPGLLRQHLTAVDAAVQVSNAKIKGNDLHSSELEFSPGEVMPGSFKFRIGTAGSTTLVLQTILPVLMTAKTESQITIEGGTHNPYAPPYDFFEKSFVPVINNSGPKLSPSLERVGFFPAGGGCIKLSISPTTRIKPIDLVESGILKSRFAVSLSSKISKRVGEDEVTQVQHRLNLSAEECHSRRVNSHGPGNILFIGVEYQNVTEIFTGFGQIGVSLKKVVNQAVREYQNYQQAGVPVGSFLADQLLIPIAMSGKGRFKTLKPSMHTLTNIEVINKFLDIKITASQIEELQWLIEL